MDPAETQGFLLYDRGVDENAFHEYDESHVFNEFLTIKLTTMQKNTQKMNGGKSTSPNAQFSHAEINRLLRLAPDEMRHEDRSKYQKLQSYAASVQHMPPTHFESFMGHSDFLTKHLCRNPHLSGPQLVDMLHEKRLKNNTDAIIKSDYLINLAQNQSVTTHMLGQIVNFVQKHKNKFAPANHFETIKQVLAHKNCTATIVTQHIGKHWVLAHGNEESISTLLQRFGGVYPHQTTHSIAPEADVPGIPQTENQTSAVV